MTNKTEINVDEVNKFLNSWATGVIEIGKTFKDGGDTVDKAKEFIDSHYAFDFQDVLFKPTYTKEVVFRNNKEEALSYFISGDIKEDKGFALKPWEEISLDKIYTLTEHNITIVMGILNLKPLDSFNKIRLAFTFVLIKDDNDQLKIKVHHSSEI
ncbi:MAG: hypothetical protein VX847_05030 [Pseudomonadota bacterium]|nr:hypothetical protein [Pseudomonadota bacterium]